MKVTVELAAAGTGVPRRTIYEWIRQERLTTSAGRGRAVLVDSDEVLELAGHRKDGRLPRVDHSS